MYRPPTALRAPALVTFALLCLAAAPAEALNEFFSPGWGGPGCTPVAELKQVVDDAFAASPAADFLGNGRGSGAAGYSVALSHPGCGTLRYAVGTADVAAGTPMTPFTYHHVASLTKPLTTGIVLALDEAGLFGPAGLDTPVSQFFTAAEIDELTVGTDPAAPRCPATIQATDRATGQFGPTVGTCPDLSQITLRHLLNGNHGLWDSGVEFDRDLNGFIDTIDYSFERLFDFAGLPHAVLPEGADTAYELLAADGLLGNPDATLGGSSIVDFERSFGNTGYVLLGLVAERVTGLPYSLLLLQHVSLPLGVLPMVSITEPVNPGLPLAFMYTVTTGAELAGFPENLFGLYPQVTINGNPAINVYDLDNPGGPGAGGEGSAVATVPTYHYFFDRLVTGAFLGAGAQAAYDAAFIPLDEDPSVAHGFGVFRFEGTLGPVYQKGGSSFGTNCDALHLVATGTTAVACANSNDLFIGGLVTGVPPTMVDVEDITGPLILKAIGF